MRTPKRRTALILASAALVAAAPAYAQDKVVFKLLGRLTTIQGEDDNAGALGAYRYANDNFLSQTIAAGTQTTSTSSYYYWYYEVAPGQPLLVDRFLRCQRADRGQHFRGPDGSCQPGRDGHPGRPQLQPLSP